MTGAPLIDHLARGGLSDSSVKGFPGSLERQEFQEPPMKLPLTVPSGRVNQPARLRGFATLVGWLGGRPLSLTTRCSSASGIPHHRARKAFGLSRIPANG